MTKLIYSNHVANRIIFINFDTIKKVYIVCDLDRIGGGRKQTIKIYNALKSAKNRVYYLNHYYNKLPKHEYNIY